MSNDHLTEAEVRKRLEEAQRKLARIQATIGAIEGYNGDYPNTATDAEERGIRKVRVAVQAVLDAPTMDDLPDENDSIARYGVPSRKL